MSQGESVLEGIVVSLYIEDAVLRGIQVLRVAVLNLEVVVANTTQNALVIQAITAG